MANPLPNLTGASFTPMVVGGSSTVPPTTLFPTLGGQLNLNQNIKVAWSSLGTGLGQINQIVALLQLLTAAQTVTLDLSAAMANLVGNTGATFARLKGVLFALLNANQDQSNGTTASKITIGGAATPARLFFSDGSVATAELEIENGGFILAATPSAVGRVIDGTHKLLKIVNNDGANAAAVAIVLFGGDA